ncbi:DUF4097 domain-containing protein [Bacillus sp. FJAT-27251]|uniref:DUF4097 family beta strand repeat-containing protein n=1 Tax=Bacillus sp. FJAT-27251 TaxID=1684142 RepID=UPI0006A7865E|nr:DUF4097 domain-containing protein [Bacillus sp. FJAT-27251]
MKEERKRILAMVEEGKLSVDEALLLIEELDKKEKNMEEKKAALLTELSTTVKDEGAKAQGPFKEDSSSHKLQSAMDKVVDFVDSAFKKIKDFDLDFNFGQSVDITHIFQQGGAYLNQLDIDVANGSVKIVPWDESEVRIECSAKVYRVENQDEARRKLLEDAIFAIEGQKLRFSVQQKWMKVEAMVHIPRADYETARVRLFNGPISAENLSVKDFKAKTANGKVSFANLICKKLETETANGPITVAASHIYELEAETINGALRVDGSLRHAELQSFNGSITCKATNEDCELLEAKTATGGIDLYVPEGIAASGELKSNLGSFKLGLDGLDIIEEKSEMVQKSLRFKPKGESYSPLRVYADSKTGAIALRSAK